MFEAVFTHPWPWWAAGLAIGLFVPVFAWATGKTLGVSGGYSEMCALGAPRTADRWKLWFVVGLPIGGLVSSLASGRAEISTTIPALESALGLGLYAQLALLAAGGALIGYGARLAGGCTSGHSIVGIALGARASLVATVGFMLGGFATTWAVIGLFGRAA